MKKLLWVWGLFTVFFLSVLGRNKLMGAQIGETFTDADNYITYEITSVGDNPTCSVVAWENDSEEIDKINNKKIIIPETVVHDETTYMVTAISPVAESLAVEWVNEFEIPETVQNIDVTSFMFYMNEASDEIPSGKIKFVFKCAPKAFKQLERITVNEPALESMIYVPKKYLEEYKQVLSGKTACVFFDNDRESRSYTGLSVTYIGDETALPEGFMCDGSCYRILNPKKKTVSLIKKPKVLDKEYEGSIYEQPANVYFRGDKYTVTKIEYYAFCEASYNCYYGVKLPDSITSIDSKSIGWNITSLDLGDSSITTIPKSVVNGNYDEYDMEPLLRKVVLPKSCTRIMKKAFYNCKYLKNVTLTTEVSMLGTKAFSSKCKKIYVTGDSLPDGIENQPMKSTKVYVKEELLNEAKNVLRDMISKKKCRVLRFID